MIYNFTPHTLNVRATKDGEDLLVLPSVGEARVSMDYSALSNLSQLTEKLGFNVYAPKPTGFSFNSQVELKEGDIVVMSFLAVEYIKKHPETHKSLWGVHLVSPGELVRDSAGTPIACVGLQAGITIEVIETPEDDPAPIWA